MMDCGLNNSASQVTEDERGVCGIQDKDSLLLTLCYRRVFHVLLFEDGDEVGTALLGRIHSSGQETCLSPSNDSVVRLTINDRRT